MSEHSRDDLTIKCLICGEEEKEEVTPLLVRPLGNLFEDEFHDIGVISICPSCWDVLRERMFMFVGTKENLAKIEEDAREERIKAEIEKLTGELEP